MKRSFAAGRIEPMVNRIAERYESQKLRAWLEKLKGHMIEQSPNYKNLFGTIERVVDRLGKVVTDFTRIKSGSLIRANGGYLVVNMLDALVEPLVWKELKQTLKSGQLKIETYDPFAMFSTSGMDPEPVPLDVKLVVLGNPLLYHMLHLYDEDFRKIFKVKAEFVGQMDRQGKFHVWAIDRVDEGLELFGGIPAGRLDEEGTFHRRVDQRLRDLARAVQEQRAVPSERGFPVPAPAADGPRDPRPINVGEAKAPAAKAKKAHRKHRSHKPRKHKAARQAKKP